LFSNKSNVGPSVASQPKEKNFEKKKKGEKEEKKD